MASSSIANTWQEQLMALRALTSTTGIIHEAQRLQIKQWGALAFQHVGAGNWEAVVDTDGHIVTYKILKTKRAPKNFPKYVAALDRSIHWLFGDEWSLRIQEGRKFIYTGERLVSAETKVNEQRKKLVEAFNPIKKEN